MEKPEDVNASCASDCSPAVECDLNPVLNGSYNWGDRKNTTVTVLQDGSAVICQGDQHIVLECLGFFRDATTVFDRAIDAILTSDLGSTLFYKSLGTSRNLPFTEWD